MSRLLLQDLKAPLKIKSFGNSMYPLLHDHDICSIKKISFSKILINDIICVKKNNKLFTHRVIYKQDNYLITKGDNNVKSDGKIYSRNIIGKLTQLKRNNSIFEPEDVYLIQSSLYLKEILRVKKQFEKHKIDFLVLKGLPLHLYLEGSHPRRVYADCDLLIRRKKLRQAELILSSLGFTLADTSLINTRKNSEKKPELTYYKKLGNFTISLDIHLEVVFLMTQVGNNDSFYPKKLLLSLTDKFIKEKIIINIYNNKIPILSAENLFIYLLLHLYHHNFKGTFRYDLILKVVENKLNYETISQTIKSYKLINFINPCLLLLDKYYRTQLSKCISENINYKSDQIERIVKHVNIFDDENRIEAGIRRFKLNFILSPNNFLKKYRILISPWVIYTAYWALFSRKGRN